MRIVSLDIRDPSDETGGSFSHAPDSGELAPIRHDFRCHPCSYPEGCQKCSGLMADPKISVDL